MINAPDGAAEPKRLIGYSRVSTSNQKLDLQLDALASVDCEEVFEDHGVSGAKAERPGLDRLMAHLRAGDMLVDYKLDRLGRPSFHLADLLNRLNQMDVQFCSLTEGINTSGFGGRLVHHVFAAVAEFHRDLIRENAANGLRAAAARGTKIGRPRKLSLSELKDARFQIEHNHVSYAEIARRLSVSESTVRRWLRP